jgi:hypothetical protein
VTGPGTLSRASGTCSIFGHVFLLPESRFIGRSPKMFFLLILAPQPTNLF